MALVVLLRGVNVGGHRTFRPTLLATELQHLDVFSVGAAGTFVVHADISSALVRAEFSRRLPFDTQIMIFNGRHISRLMSLDPFAGRPQGTEITRFVSVLSRTPRTMLSLPLQLPVAGKWLMRIISRENRFVFGMYRRHMKVIGCLGALDRIFGMPVTTRNWNTIAAIAKALHP